MIEANKWIIGVKLKEQQYCVASCYFGRVLPILRFKFVSDLFKNFTEKRLKYFRPKRQNSMDIVVSHHFFPIRENRTLN